MLNELQYQILAQKHLSPDAQEYAEMQLEALKIVFDNPHWNFPDEFSTDHQLGYLAGTMDLEKPDRIEALRLLTGLDLVTSKDMRLTKWIASALIDYYVNGEGSKFNDTVGYVSATVVRQAKRAARDAARQAEADTLVAPGC